MILLIFFLTLSNLNLGLNLYLPIFQNNTEKQLKSFMQIDLDLLYSWGAVAKKYKKNETIFHEDEVANFYYQILDGGVRLFNSNDEGKEFTQGLFGSGDGFGEPPLFINETYPSKALTIQESTIIKLSKDKFLKILDEYPSIQKDFLVLLAQKIHSKSKTSKEIINQKPEYRVVAFLNSYKKKSGCGNEKILIPFTRQEIANNTGLRVETVIRVFTKMNKANKVEIINHKIYY
jgi:CRP/FNR family transcriptional regulator